MLIKYLTQNYRFPTEHINHLIKHLQKTGKLEATEITMEIDGD